MHYLWRGFNFWGPICDGKFGPRCLKMLQQLANYTESKDDHAEKGNAEIHSENSWNQLSIIKDQTTSALTGRYSVMAWY